MQRIGERALRLFKLLAGHEPEEAMSAFAIALYVFALFVAMLLVVDWMAGA
jgi:hypothetical protein